MGSSKGLSQNSTLYELSKLSAHSLEGVRWELTLSPLGVHLELIKWSLQNSSPNEVNKLQPG